MLIKNTVRVLRPDAHGEFVHSEHGTFVKNTMHLFTSCTPTMAELTDNERRFVPVKKHQFILF